MKKVFIYYDNRLGRNDGSPLYYWNVLKNLPGIEVTHLIPNGDISKFGKADLNIWVDWGEDALTNILNYTPFECPRPSAYVTSDTHLGYEYRLNKAKEFDYVFCNQKRAVEEFARDGISTEKLHFHMHAVEPKAYPNKPVAIKKYDIGFIGFVTFKKRAEMLDRMFKEFPNFFFGQRLFENAAEIFRKSKIVFNTAAVDDINMRIFETLATGSFLLTEWVETLPEQFENKKHLVWYKSMDEAVELAKYYFEHEKEREEIARAGMEEVLAKHTYRHRVIKVLKTAMPDWYEGYKDQLI